ncbi:hypothetical protein ACFPC0_19755 [Streptomyces andamanensis]|uniref:Uncharacterized protein n=1 Tax=Streptomyces andamanensis TaxID=1565035 RepID=A0ABV8TH91_9ACTN
MGGGAGHAGLRGRPSPALIARAGRGNARFFALQAPAAAPGDHDQDGDAASAR